MKYGLFGLYLQQQNGIGMILVVSGKDFSAVLPPTYWMSNMQKAETANALYTVSTRL